MTKNDGSETRKSSHILCTKRAKRCSLGCIWGCHLSLLSNIASSLAPLVPRIHIEEEEKKKTSGKNFLPRGTNYIDLCPLVVFSTISCHELTVFLGFNIGSKKGKKDALNIGSRKSSANFGETTNLQWSLTLQQNSLSQPRLVEAAH